MNGTNIKFMDIFKFLTFMLIYKRKIKLVHRKLKQCATSAIRCRRTTNNNEISLSLDIGDDQKSRSKLIFVVPILRIENFEKYIILKKQE